ncbi:carbohydrate-binding module family 13 protein [Plenodomus tracheiphilus IPT5]|uniref:Carbohydrate-binding module family 13 protein n=1 Tax=Plenodomus tracheiphilus IPT5 TaxID=1408161 RepID=A0A6A7APG4_9PLEO|nr:carbohydrate-binding module family 13 protein [Plenodomus tracheiphilus IPT5]
MTALRITETTDDRPLPSLAKDPSPKVVVEQAPTFNEQTNYVPVKTIIMIFLACATVDLLALMDQTTLAASLTIISKDLDASSESAWVAGAYFLTSTSFQLLYGRLSDIWSRKVLLVVGIFIFFFGSLAASLATTSLQLILFRAFTGIGGGGLMSVAQMIVSDIVPLRERGKYQGILGSVVALANGIGPIIGGALASGGQGNWRWIFRLNLFLSALTTACVCFFMPLRKVKGSWKKKVAAIDFPGCILSLSGSTLLVLSLTWAGGEYSWSSVHVISTLVIGIFVMIAFALWQWKGTSVPLVPVEIFKSKVVNGAALTMFVNGWNFLVQVYYIPTFYQLVYGYSAVKSGALLLPITLTQTLFSTLSGLVIHKTGRYRECLLVGWAAWAIGLGLYSTLDSPSLGQQIGFGLLTGFGLGNTLQPSLIAIQAGVERQHMAVVTSTRNFVRNLGGTLGLALSGTIINNVVRTSLSTQELSRPDIQLLLNAPGIFRESFGEQRTEIARGALTAAYRHGFRIIFIIGAGLNALSFVAAWILMPQITLERKDDDQLKAEGHGRHAEKNISNSINKSKMLTVTLVTLALAATSFAQIPDGYRRVYITSKQDTKFVIVPKGRTAGNTLVVQSLTSKPEQQWYIKANQTSIQLADTTLCMDAGPKSGWKDMANVYLRECADTEQQKWVAQADGRISLQASTGTQQCLDLQYLRATQNNPVGLYNCAGLGNTGAADKGINWPLQNATI